MQYSSFKEVEDDTLLELISDYKAAVVALDKYLFENERRLAKELETEEDGPWSSMPYEWE